MSKTLRIVLLLAATAGFSTASFGQTPSTGGQGGPGGQGGQGGHPPGPPPQAIAACQGKSAGAACSFVGRQGENLSGTCFAPPARQAANNGANSGNGGTPPAPPVACRPDRGGQGGQGGQGGSAPAR